MHYLPAQLRRRLPELAGTNRAIAQRVVHERIESALAAAAELAAFEGGPPVLARTDQGRLVVLATGDRALRAFAWAAETPGAGDLAVALRPAAEAVCLAAETVPPYLRAPAWTPAELVAHYMHRPHPADEADRATALVDPLRVAAIRSVPLDLRHDLASQIVTRHPASPARTTALAILMERPGTLDRADVAGTMIARHGTAADVEDALMLVSGRRVLEMAVHSDRIEATRRAAEVASATPELIRDASSGGDQPSEVLQFLCDAFPAAAIAAAAVSPDVDVRGLDYRPGAILQAIGREAAAAAADAELAPLLITAATSRLGVDGWLDWALALVDQFEGDTDMALDLAAIRSEDVDVAKSCLDVVQPEHILAACWQLEDDDDGPRTDMLRYLVGRDPHATLEAAEALAAADALASNYRPDDRLEAMMRALAHVRPLWLLQQTRCAARN
jgi:hypothetical protein